MPFVAIPKSSDCRTRGGIVSRFFATICENVTSLTFDATGSITAIAMVASTTWKEINIAKGTGSFNQSKDASQNITQVLTIQIKGQNPTTRAALRALSKVCCGHYLIQDNNLRWHYAGISHNENDDSYVDEDMESGEGFANTEDTSGVNQYQETVQCISNFYAPFWTLGEAGITTS